MTSDRDRGPLAAVGIGVALLLCCAAPALAAAGAVGAAGALLRSGWLIALAGAALLAAVGWTAVRRRRRL
jgi:LPXTG-motif cell wall-anchored protein